MVAYRRPRGAWHVGITAECECPVQNQAAYTLSYINKRQRFVNCDTHHCSLSFSLSIYLSISLSQLSLSLPSLSLSLSLYLSLSLSLSLSLGFSVSRALGLTG